MKNFEEKELGVNPFQYGLKVRVRTVEFEGQYKKEEGDWITVQADVEYDSYCKVYSNAERRLIVNGLSLRSKELLLWLFFEIEYGRDYVWINKKRCMKELNIKSVNTFKQGLNGLIRYGFITPTLINDYYWINPDFFFKGDRIKKYFKNVVRVNS